jgi:hypothetical protein
VLNIDDRLPVTNMGQPVMAKKSTSGGAWWLPVLEKAYAKFNLNYFSL